MALQAIDRRYNKLDFLTRTLLILASQRVPNNVWQVDTPEMLAACKEEFLINKRRERMGRPPLLPLTPIIIDVTRLPSSLTKAHLKEIRELLGITSVRGSTYVNWRGTVIHRREHERRIPSAVDRRNAQRDITAKALATLQLRPDRPTLVVDAPAPAPKAG